jgi:hypothetical protein
MHNYGATRLEAFLDISRLYQPKGARLLTWGQHHYCFLMDQRGMHRTQPRVR